MNKEEILEYEMDQLGLVMDAELTQSAYKASLNAIDSFGEKMAILFSEWTSIKGWSFDQTTGYWIVPYSPKEERKTSIELYTLFLNQSK
jgi:hypothetical protein